MASKNALHPCHPSILCGLRINICLSGGTNLRVGFIELLGNEEEITANGTNEKANGHGDTSSHEPVRLRRVLEKSWPILEHLKNEKAEALFSWIGACIAEVVRDGCERFNLPSDRAIPLGITFSFPMEQNTLSEASLMAMGKGFAITSKLDLGSHLMKGYERSRDPSLPPLKVAAITNDAVATMVSFVYQSNETPTRKAAMGLICGTGCNATILLPKSSLHQDKLPAKVGVLATDDEENVKVAVNTEMSINGTAPALRKFGLISEWDTRLDEEGDKPGFQPMEYMTAGRYLGELGRLILVDYLCLQLGHPRSALPPLLLQRFGLTTTFLSNFRPPSAPVLLQMLETEFPVATSDFQWTEDIALILYEIAKAIEVRAAGIIAASVIGLLVCAGDMSLRQPLGEKGQAAPTNGEHAPIDLVVGYTGGCIAHFQDYLTDCQDFLDRTMEAEYGESPPVRVLLSPCHDGGITGAGVLAGSSQARSSCEA